MPDYQSVTRTFCRAAPPRGAAASRPGARTCSSPSQSRRQQGGPCERAAALRPRGPAPVLREDQSDLANWTRGDRKARFEQTAERHVGLTQFAGPFLSRRKFVDEQGECAHLPGRARKHAPATAVDAPDVDSPPDPRAGFRGWPPVRLYVERRLTD